MNPNGLDEAASMACQASMPSWWEAIASSLISAMLTWRKVFSISLVSSATRVESTGTVRSTSRR